MIDKKYLIETNRKILERHKRKTNESVWIETTARIDDIIPKVNSVGNSDNREKDLIEKATTLLAMITWTQPFFDGNRRTGIVAATKFLRDNGYDLDMGVEKENLEIRNMLSELKKHSSELHVETMNKLSFYISKRIKPYEPRR